MKPAILFISFGTSYREARENSLDCILHDLKKAGNGMPAFLAYTSSVILNKLREEENLHIDTVQEAAERALAAGADCLYVICSHMIPGIEYEKVERVLAQYRSAFSEIKIASPVLGEKEDCGRLVPVLRDMLQPEPEKNWILMGHGTEDSANVRYAQMNEAFAEAGLTNVRIASVEAKPDLEDAIRFLKEYGGQKEVMVHPFMVVAGDHAHNDMAGAEESYVTRIREAGYPVCAIVKGLGEYPQFRALYVDKLQKLMAGTLYGIGVGPGDPELLTLKAARLIKECDWIGIPAKDAACCRAYRIAQQAVPQLADKPVIAVPIPMTTRADLLEQAYREGSRQLIRLLREGKNVAFLNLGDPSVYGSYMELHRRIRQEGYTAKMVSGVPSFCAVAAALDLPLGDGKEMIHILPGCYGAAELEKLSGTKILMKSGSRLGDAKETLAALQERGVCMVKAVSDCGMEGERICHHIAKLPDDAGYFTTIVVKDMQ